MATVTSTVVATYPMTIDTAFPNSTLKGQPCPTCGQDRSHSEQDARRRIRELELQVETLSAHSSQTGTKLAECEEELRRVRSQLTNKTSSSSSQRTGSSSISSTSSSARSYSVDKSSPTSSSQASSDSPQPQSRQQQQQQQQQASQSRLATLTSFLPYRRGTATPTPPPVPALPAAFQQQQQQRPPTSALESATVELQNALNREQNLRKAAETQLSQTNLELEELTAQLFSQANEMVAQERKARVKLEERVAVLERRDAEKRKRLDRLEQAIRRVERLRELVG